MLTSPALVPSARIAYLTPFTRVDEGEGKEGKEGSIEQLLSITLHTVLKGKY